MSTAPATPPPDGDYLAFISYAREDAAFARRLEAALEAWPRPQAAGSGPVQVFRDENDFTGAVYESALGQHLQQAGALIVVCSPSARQSPYVNDEIRRYAALHGADRIFPVLLSGLPDNEADALKAFPPALLEASRDRGMPLGAEYRGIRPERDSPSGERFAAEWYKLLGNLYGLPPAAVQAQDQQRLGRRRLQQLRWAVGAVVVAVVTVVVFWDLRRDAEIEKVRAENERARAETEVSLRQNLESRLQALGICTADGQPGCRPLQSLAAAPASEAPPPASPPPPAMAAPLRPRVYVHIRDNAQRAQAELISQRLQATDLGDGQRAEVPGIERLDLGPQRQSELRYFRDAEAGEARRIADVLTGAGVRDLAVRKVPGFENSTRVRQRQYELWLAP